MIPLLSRSRLVAQVSLFRAITPMIPHGYGKERISKSTPDSSSQIVVRSHPEFERSVTRDSAWDPSEAEFERLSRWAPTRCLGSNQAQFER